MAKIKIIPDYVFRNKNPYIVGIKVMTGRFRIKDVIIFDNGDTGTIIGIQNRGRDRTQARKDELLAIAIEGVHWKRSNERGYAIIKSP